MARKNLLEGLADMPGETGAQAAYPMRGAGKSLVRSLDELARQADRFLEGETVVEIDPANIDASFISDRLEDDGEAFGQLLEAIRARGQDSPVLLRPHAKKDGHYQVVFGHRRVRAAMALGIAVKAVVKALDDRAHVIAQGQENSARANLSFIERALFARRLEELGYDREVIGQALAANAASVSKMLSVTGRIPRDLIEAIGPAPGIGRERWVELSLLAGRGANAAQAAEMAASADFRALPSDERFAALHAGLNRRARPVRKSAAAPAKTLWKPADQSVTAEISQSGKAFSLSMKAGNAGKFGAFLSARLDALYAEFLSENGD